MQDEKIEMELPREIAVAEGFVSGVAIVTKFGANPDVDGAEDIWCGGGDYTGFPTQTETLTLVSTSAADASAGTGARTVTIIGLDASYDEVTEVVTLNGTTPVVTTATFHRVNYAYISSAGSGKINAGDISIKHTSTTANIFCNILTGFGINQSAAYTVPRNKKLRITHYDFAMEDNTANRGRIALKVQYNGATTYQQIVRTTVITTETNVSDYMAGGILLPEKTDIVPRVLSVVSANSVISANWDGYLIDMV